MVTETVIEIDFPRGEFSTAFGPVGGPPRSLGGVMVTGMDPVILVTPDVLGACLRPEGSTYDGITAYASPDGFLTLFTPSGGTWVYELHPARWSDNQPPSIYLAVWPD